MARKIANRKFQSPKRYQTPSQNRAKQSELKLDQAKASARRHAKKSCHVKWDEPQNPAESLRGKGASNRRYRLCWTENFKATPRARIWCPDPGPQLRVCHGSANHWQFWN